MLSLVSRPVERRISVYLDVLMYKVGPLDNEIYCFLEYLVAQHVYDASPQRLAENFSDVFTHRIMEFDRYMTICHSLCTDPQFAQSGNSYRFVTPGDKIVCLQSGFSKLGTQLQALAFHRGTTNIVLDDHKIHDRGTDAHKLGIATSYQRNGQPNISFPKKSRPIRILFRSSCIHCELSPKKKSKIAKYPNPSLLLAWRIPAPPSIQV